MIDVISRKIIKKSARNIRILSGIAIIGGIEGISTIFISSLLYYLNEPFTMTSHWVSNLGVGSNGSNHVFNYGLMISAIFLGIFLIGISRELWGNGRKNNIVIVIAFLIGLMSVIGIFLLTLNDMFSTYSILHQIGAYTYFTGSVFFILLYSIILRINDYVSNKLLVTGIIMTIIGILMPLMTVICMNWFMYPELAISEISLEQWNSMLSNMSPAFKGVRVIEWSMLICFFIWTLQFGFEIKNKAKKLELSLVNF